MKIAAVTAREILDSRGNPTVEAEVVTDSGAVGRAGVPSGASKGDGEAAEKRDGDPSRYFGQGVLKAVASVNGEIASLLGGVNATDQRLIDSIMLEADGTDDKHRFGANAILSVSLAAAEAAANELHLPLFRYLGGSNAHIMPLPLMNILNGGAHADNNLDIQEFMIVPVGAESERSAVRMGAEVFRALKNVLKSSGLSTAVGDEGGFAPDIGSDREALDLIAEAIEKAGYKPGDDIMISLDAAASEWFSSGRYVLPKSGKSYSSEELSQYFLSLAEAYPIYSIEDPLGETDWEGWQAITRLMKKKCRLVGDDLFVTNPKIIREGILKGCADTVLIKPNQIGTLTETFDAIEAAHSGGYKTIISHRSGETEDTKISDIAVASSSGHIKTGSLSRSERTAKYNRLTAIEDCLSGTASFFSIKI